MLFVRLCFSNFSLRLLNLLRYRGLSYSSELSVSTHVGERAMTLSGWGPLAIMAMC